MAESPHGGVLAGVRVYRATTALPQDAAATEFAEVDDPASIIPVVDIAPLVALFGELDPSLPAEEALAHVSPAARDCADRIREACETVGFFLVRGHGVPTELKDELFRQSRRFFGLPVEQRDKIAMSKGGLAWRGHFRLGEELTRGRPDHKLGLYLGEELPADHPKCRAGWPMHGPNQWPGARQPELRPVVLDYMSRLTGLGHTLMGGLALGLRLSAGPFAFRRQFSDEPFTPFRIFFYPKDEQTWHDVPAAGEVGASADAEAARAAPVQRVRRFGVQRHTDYGVLTILAVDSPGLEVLLPEGYRVERASAGAAGPSVGSGEDPAEADRWFPVPVVPDTFCINVGDMTEVWTAGRLRATPHRVRNYAAAGSQAAFRDRVSAPFFFDPAFDAVIRPFPELVGAAVREAAVAETPAEADAAAVAYRRDGEWASGRGIRYGAYITAKVMKVFPSLGSEAMTRPLRLLEAQGAAATAAASAAATTAASAAAGSGASNPFSDPSPAAARAVRGRAPPQASHHWIFGDPSPAAMHWHSPKLQPRRRRRRRGHSITVTGRGSRLLQREAAHLLARAIEEGDYHLHATRSHPLPIDDQAPDESAEVALQGVMEAAAAAHETSPTGGGARRAPFMAPADKTAMVARRRFRHRVARGGRLLSDAEAIRRKHGAPAARGPGLRIRKPSADMQHTDGYRPLPKPAGGPVGSPNPNIAGALGSAATIVRHQWVITRRERASAHLRPREQAAATADPPAAAPLPGHKAHKSAASGAAGAQLPHGGRCPYLSIIERDDPEALIAHDPSAAVEMCPHMRAKSTSQPAQQGATLPKSCTGEAAAHRSTCGGVNPPASTINGGTVVTAASPIAVEKVVKKDTPPGRISAAEYDQQFGDTVDRIRSEGRYRHFRELQRRVGSFPHSKLASGGPTGKPVVGWCSNDYLGMGQHPAVLGAIDDALKRDGAGAGGTRNISGTNTEHVRLESELADLHGQGSALLFTSCFVCNDTVLSTLPDLFPDLHIFSDRMNHASMIQGIRRGNSHKHIYNHNDVADLRAQLEAAEAASPGCPKLIAFESVNSMEGTIAPIHEICDLADEFGAMTFCDEVHAVGLYGDRGGGIAERDSALHRLTMVTGTLGKAYGVVGGYLAASERLVDAMRLTGAGFIFTTSLPPYVAAGARTAVAYLKESDTERAVMHSKALRLKSMLLARGLPLMDSVSHIVPMLIGDSRKAQVLADRLLHEHGLYIQPINYPTVPRGTERLRMTPSPVHTNAMMDQLVDTLDALWTELELPRMHQLDDGRRRDLQTLGAHLANEVAPLHYAGPSGKSFRIADGLLDDMGLYHTNLQPSEIAADA